jgi:HPt (histidine-containing phosphotransfer) domain-containing protein
MGPATETYYSTICTDAEMIEIVQEFLDELPLRLGQLQTALETRDWCGLARYAHQLKGAGGSHGFPQLTPLAQRLESWAKAAQPDESRLAATLDELINVAARLRTVPAESLQ